MKKSLVVFLLLGIVAAASAGWKTMTSPVTDHLNGIFVMDDQHFWVVGKDGLILQYNDQSWTPMTSPTANDLNAIAMLNDSEGWAIGDEGTIMHFHNGTWELLPGFSSQVTFEELAVIDADNIYVAGYSLFDGGFVMKWDGIDFKQVYPAAGETNAPNILDIAAAGPDDIWVIGRNYLRVHYDGISWNVDTSPLPPEYQGYQFICMDLDKNANPVVVSRNDEPRIPSMKIYSYSEDTGWVLEYTEFEPRASEISICQKRCFLVCHEGRILEKTIFGWKQNIPDVVGNQLNDVKLVDMSRGWAVGDGGIILRYEEPAIDLQFAESHLQAGTDFNLSMELQNPGTAAAVDVFVLLEAYGAFYFWPSWGTTADFESRSLNSSSFVTEALFDFTWPAGTGMGEAKFWGAFVENGNLTAYDIEEFDWR